ARALDRPAAAIRIAPPAPRPPLALRPRRLSVTRIETLRRDPYAIFAERILRFAPLNPIDLAMGARDFGINLHLALGEFTREFAGNVLPQDARARLLAAARRLFGALGEDADFLAFQWPRIERNIDFFLRWESERRQGLAAIFSEVAGTLDIALPDGETFTLTAIADRIELDRDGRLTFIDYKTGQPPGLNEVAVGFAPQLTLEAAMAKRGAFADVPAGTIADGVYVKLGAGAGGGDEISLSRIKGIRFADLAERHFDGLMQLLEEFASEETPYLSRPYPKFVSDTGPYDHLARVKEWSATGAAIDEPE
ncbi:MAG: PD-(D/E)XK nuclease family protein, partial [Methylobacteriaceae bacterium]|nr:PD-(D/E)XK nuclease family protein [Methylobacteriaceae bacterium]